jgi:hypothetical protein
MFYFLDYINRKGKTFQKKESCGIFFTKNRKPQLDQSFAGAGSGERPLEWNCGSLGFTGLFGRALTHLVEPLIQ